MPEEVVLQSEQVRGGEEIKITVTGPAPLVDRMSTVFERARAIVNRWEEEPSGVDEEELDRRFTYHPPDNVRAHSHARIRNVGHTLAELIHTEAPDGREKSLALTKLEEAVMWANAAIARAPHEEEEDG